MILSSLQEELKKPFIVKHKYYCDEEEKMITGYVNKTRLSHMLKKSKEDEVFECLIRGVGRLKCLRIILENMFKELKATNKWISSMKEVKNTEIWLNDHMKPPSSQSLLKEKVKKT